jgi:signal transduction histidine kinase
MQKLLRVKILLVDDRENNLLSMESIFAKDNYQLTRANSGKEALKILLKECDFTLILMDVEMPGLNGFETATLIYQREKSQHIPIIFISAHSYGDEHIFKAYKAGAIDYIYKPIQPDLLRAKVSIYIELFKKNHQLLEQEQKLKAINKSLEIEVKDRLASEEKVKELNKQLLKNIDQLESTNKELDQFAFIASHDLQEPLRKIKIFSNRIAFKYEDKLDHDGKLLISKVQASCERMQNLINDVLSFSKIAGEKNSLVYSDINNILQDVLLDMDVQIQEKNAQVNIDPLPKLFVYPPLIKLLFENIINNSIKYSRQDIPPVIQITAKNETFENISEDITTKKYSRINIQDNGIGFEQKYAEQIFKMFKRLHGNSEYAGTGIGLAICKKIIEEHQGYISVKSVVNEGTVFTLSFPADISQPVQPTDKFTLI